MSNIEYTLADAGLVHLAVKRDGENEPLLAAFDRHLVIIRARLADQEG